ncbi:sORF2 [Sparus aurata papillomavirus 1]|uniref:SORF2 n=1 Tax=Sparus aurata papillomavirus 1 TaxID=1885928 RepID=A0A1B2RW90_9PAPI|nr:sORF2 [Sparus aurata papillomavirus 1]AOC55274.1 sORF2 [Sparus aurata papillomavirus 1]
MSTFKLCHCCADPCKCTYYDLSDMLKYPRGFTHITISNGEVKLKGITHNDSSAGIDLERFNLIRVESPKK